MVQLSGPTKIFTHKPTTIASFKKYFPITTKTTIPSMNNPPPDYGSSLGLTTYSQPNQMHRVGRRDVDGGGGKNLNYEDNDRNAGQYPSRGGPVYKGGPLGQEGN